ncbi:MAG: cell surface protein, partial [Verrucomicrobiales bacterium]|nr:cell surface protein [Verrucomicrobiales bacterium]
MKHCFPILSAALSILGGGLSAAESKIDFVRDIQPILEFNCVNCHNADEAKSELRFDKAEFFFKGGEGGQSLVKGKPDESLMIELVSLPADDSDVMPPKGRPLHEHEIAKLRQWIAEGAVWPTELTLVARNEADFKGAEPLKDKGKKIVKVEAFPLDITLEKKRDTQSVVVMATYEDDTTVDVTANATFTFADPSLVGLKARNHFIPMKDGQTELEVKVADKAVKIPVVVKEAAVDRPINFHLDVMPIFMSEGCNTGACHGSARGQNGFMLSLFGYDPDGD